MAIGIMLRLVCGRFAAVETWYSVGAGNITPAGEAAGRKLADARAGCLASNCYVEGFRVFDTASKYSIKNISLSGPVNNGALGIVGRLPATTPNLADIQQTSLMCRAYSDAPTRARTSTRELFGVPDNVIQTTPLGNRVYTPTAAFTDGIEGYIFELVNNWQFRVLKVATPYTITGLAINATPPGLLGVMASIGSDPTIVPGKPVRIRNSRRQGTVLTLNGRWTVDSIVPPVAPSTASTIYLIGSQGYDPNAYDPRGSVEGISYDFAIVKQYTPIRPMGRKRGGRLGLPRGRLSARVR